MANFIHLHNHSDYSLLDGAAPISEYVKRAKELGMAHLGLTDHGALFGALHFEKACRSAGINPIIGCEVYVAVGSRFDRPAEGRKYHHLCLYCKDEAGYHNLMKLVSLSYTEGFYYKPRVDDELLGQYSEGLIASSACLAGEIPTLILNGKEKNAEKKALFYQDLFGKGNFYIEVMDHGIPEEKEVRNPLIVLSQKTGIPIIATNDIHYIHKDHAKAQDILVCIGTNKTVSESNRMKMERPEFYFKTAEEMEALFSDVPEALENTLKLAESCNLKIPQPGPKLPAYKIPESFADEGEYLRHIAFDGAKVRYGDNLSDTVRKRLDYELSIIIGEGFAGYILIVWDFVNWAKKQNISVGPGRGSAAGSLAAYALGITDVEPLKYNLLFERFLNSERVSMPDIDIDFCYERRSEVIEYVMKKYGRENVAGICTFGTLKTKAVLKDVARVLEIPFEESNAITALIPDKFSDDKKIKVSVKSVLEHEPRLQEYYDKGGNYKDTFDIASILEGMSRHVSTHACGMVIGQSEISDFVPLYKDQKTNTVSSEYSMDIIEPCGLVKMDFLGLKTLTLLKKIEELVRNHTPDFDVDKIPDDDKTTYKMLGKGDSSAVFQFESAGMQKILRDAKPSNLEDLIALNALYRPGPMDNIPKFVACKHGRKPIDYPDPDLKEVLEPTYGVIVYQEQVMKIAQIIGGFSLGKADILRRAMGKKKIEEMEKMKVEFVEGAVASGRSQVKAETIYELLKPFAGYGFNKSHAAAYSIIAYRTAYCRANYPAEFMAANLSNEISNPDAFKSYLAETKAMNIPILPPDINKSGKNFTVLNEQIVYGLAGLKGIGEAAVEEILRARGENGSFSSFIDFLERVPMNSVTKKGVETLITAGVFDSIGERNRATLLASTERILPLILKSRKSDDTAANLFADFEEEVAPEITFDEKPPFDPLEKLQMEKDLLGFYISGHPLDVHKGEWEKSVVVDLANPGASPANKEHTLIGLVREMREIVTKKGDRMAFLQLEDYNGTIEIILFPKVFVAGEEFIRPDAIIKVVGKIEKNSGGKTKFKAFDVLRPEDRSGNRNHSDGFSASNNQSVPSGGGETHEIMEVHIEMNDSFDEKTLAEFRNFIQTRPGKSPIFFHILGKDGKQTIMKASHRYDISSGGDTINSILRYRRVGISRAWQE